LQFEKRYELENGNIFQLLGAPAFNLLAAIFGNICVATYIWQYILAGVGARYEWWLLAICCVAVLSAANAYKSGGGWMEQ